MHKSFLVKFIQSFIDNSENLDTTWISKNSRMFYSTYMVEHYMTIKNYLWKACNKEKSLYLIIGGKVCVYKMFLII